MHMTVTFTIPESVQKLIADDTTDLNNLAREDFLVARYKDGKLSHKQLSDALGLDRWQTEDVLWRHGVSDLTAEEIQRQVQTIRKLGV
jgi:hypothetical protein